MLIVKGILEFDPPTLTRKHARQAEWKRHANCNLNCDLASYYSWFVRRRYNVILNAPQRGPHVSFIADILNNEHLYNLAKTKWNGKEVEFGYDTNVRTNGEDWWLRIYSEQLLDIREEAGLSRNPFFNLHLTIGTAADRLDKNGNRLGGGNLEHSEYIHRCIKKFEYDPGRELQNK